MLIAFRVTVEEHELLEKEAANLGISRSALIRQRVFTTKPQETPQIPPPEPPQAKKQPQTYKPASKPTTAAPNTPPATLIRTACSSCGQTNFGSICTRCGKPL